MTIFGITIPWIILAILIGIWASKLHRSVFWGVVGSIFLSPLVVGIYYLIVGPKQPQRPVIKAPYN
jgi:hypothetical protein